MAKQTETITFKPMPKWVVEGFKEALIEDIDSGCIKSMDDAFFYTKGWFTAKGYVPIEIFDFIRGLNAEGRLK